MLSGSVGIHYGVPGSSQSCQPWHHGWFLYPQVATAEVADAASYMCVAENQAGSAEKLFTLKVQGEMAERGPLWVPCLSLRFPSTYTQSSDTQPGWATSHLRTKNICETSIMFGPIKPGTAWAWGGDVLPGPYIIITEHSLCT